MGRVFPVEGVKIAWARYQDTYHCPPATAIIQISLTGKEGSFQDAIRIAREEIPDDGRPYDAGRDWRYALPEATPARYVRLVFPEGDQEGAKYPGYLCLGEVEVLAEGLAPRVATIEGAFGKVEVNVTFPALAGLYLRGPDGLDRHSLLARTGRRPWARGGYTYTVDESGERYESRLATPEDVQLSEEDGRTVLRLGGIRLSRGGDAEPVATEEWTLSAPGDGSQLIWKIVRRWERDFVSVMSGSPGLFFTFDARHRENSVTSTIWYDPLRIAARSSDIYAPGRPARRVSSNHIQTIRDRDTWAIYKLWTNWHAPADLRLEVEGGHLYRRGSYALLSEAGAVTAGGARQITRQGANGGNHSQDRRRGQTHHRLPAGRHAAGQGDGGRAAGFLRVGPQRRGGQRPKGIRLRQRDRRLVLCRVELDVRGGAGGRNAGCRAVLFAPLRRGQRFREHLAHVLSTLDDQGRAHFGYNQGGEWVDDNLHTIIGMRAYLLHSGDLALRSAEPARPGTDAGLFRPAAR